MISVNTGTSPVSVCRGSNISETMFHDMLNECGEIRSNVNTLPGRD